MKLKIVSLDISMSNLGAAVAEFDTDSNQLKILQCETFNPEISKSKQVRQNSKDVDRGYQLFKALYHVTKMADIVVVELPVGSQSARAMASYGQCTALIGALKMFCPTVIEVLPSEVKSIVGKKDASKKEVIAWVQTKHPEAPLSAYKNQINLTKAEHQADAIVAVHAAMKTDMFKHFLSVAHLYKG